MDLRIENGDYVPDGMGGLQVAEGVESALQRLMLRLTVPLGTYLPLPEYGSRLHLLSREKPSLWEAMAYQYVREVLVEESSLSLDYLEISVLGEGEIGLTLHLLWQGEEATLTMSVK